MWKQLCGCDPDITLETLTVSKMQELVQWYVKNDYCNRTIQKQFKIVKSFFGGSQNTDITYNPVCLNSNRV